MRRWFGVSSLVLIILALLNTEAVTLNLGTKTGAELFDFKIAMPSGNYNHYSLTTDWSDPGFNFSARGILWDIGDDSFTDPSVPTAPFILESIEGPAYGATIVGPATLNWSGFFDVPFESPALSEIVFIHNGALLGPDTSIWANTVLELTNVVPPTAPTVDIDLGVIGEPNGSLLGSAVTRSGLKGALYGAAGDLIGEVDEGDFGGNRPIPHGDYYFAVVSDDGHLDDRFGIVEGSGSGDVLLNWGFDDPDPALSLIEVNHTLAARESLVVKFTLGPAVSSAVPEPTGFAGFAFLASVGCLIHCHRR